MLRLRCSSSELMTALTMAVVEALYVEYAYGALLPRRQLPHLMTTDI